MSKKCQTDFISHIRKYIKGNAGIYTKRIPILLYPSSNMPNSNKSKCSPETNPDCCSCGGMPWSNISTLCHLTRDCAKKSCLVWQSLRCSEVSEGWVAGDPEPRSLLIFLHKGHHFTFEKADQGKAQVKWFEAAYPKWGKCMDAHAAMTYPSFNWDNYYEWKIKEGLLGNEALDEGFDLYIQMRQHYNTTGINHDKASRKVNKMEDEDNK